jgi:DNA polymerase-1
MERLLIVDGNSLINRAYYAFGGRGQAGELSYGGVPTNAVYGFLNMFVKAAVDLEVKYTCVAFDVRAKTFRHEMFGKYKANRRPMPDDLAAQLEELKNILRVMKVKIFEFAGYEADDVIGTISRICEKDIICIQLTADRDGLQLVSENTMLYLTKTGVSNLDVWTKERIKKEYGLEPKQLIDVKALMGDQSDNIPGAPGVGEKTALSLIRKYGSVGNAIANSEKIAANNDIVLLSKK